MLSNYLTTTEFNTQLVAHFDNRILRKLQYGEGNLKLNLKLKRKKKKIRTLKLKYSFNSLLQRVIVKNNEKSNKLHLKLIWVLKAGHIL